MTARDITDKNDIAASDGGKPITGYHVLAVTVGAFAVIIAVNLYMAFSAVSTFPGLEVKNSYVASQKFDAARQAQEALGWTVEARIVDAEVVVQITEKSGAIVDPLRVAATIGRATHKRDDQELLFTARDSAFVAPVALAPGSWQLRFSATAADGTPFEQRLSLYVGGRG